MTASSRIAGCASNCAKLPENDLVHVFDTVGADWEHFRGKRLFVTGGTGFVGKWLLETLLYANRRIELGCRITVLSRNPDDFCQSYPHLCDPTTVNFVAGDVRNFVCPEGEYQFVIHAATDVVADTTAIDLFSTCVDGARRVLDFARRAGCSDFLLVGSGAVYGRQPAGLLAIEEDYAGGPDPLDPRSAYGEGKRCAEWLAKAYADQYGFRVKVARCFAFVGPHLPLDKQFAIGNFIRDALADREIVIRGDGTAYRSYLYAADLAVWLWTMLLRAPGGVAYNVGGDEAVTIAELARRVARLAGSDKETTVTAPRDPSKQAERYVPNVRKAERELGLRAWIPLDEAIHRTLQWLK